MNALSSLCSLKPIYEIQPSLEQNGVEKSVEQETQIDNYSTRHRTQPPTAGRLTIGLYTDESVPRARRLGTTRICKPGQ